MNPAMATRSETRIGVVGRIFFGVAIVVGGLALGGANAPVHAPADAGVPEDSRWEKSIAAFAAADRDHAPPTGGVVFVGSSSIRLWDDLETQFHDRRGIIKRGFGGATVPDCTRYLDRIVIPYRPRLVLLYAGDNDLAEGRQPRDVFNDFVQFVENLHNALPGARIAFISIKPSPARAALMSKIREANERIQRFTVTRDNLDFIDVFTPMLDAAGHPRRELFLTDALHLNGAGYELWKTIIARHLR